MEKSSSLLIVILIFLGITIFCQNSDQNLFPVLDAKGHTGRVEGLFHIDGTSKIITVGEEGHIRVLDGKTGTTERLQPLFGPECIACVIRSSSISPNNKLIAIGGKIGNHKSEIWIINLSDWTIAKKLKAHLDGVRSIYFTLDGKSMISGGQNGEITIWNAQNFEKKQTLTGHSKGVISLTASPDGLTIFSTGLDHATFLWKKDIYGKYKKQFLRGHYGFVISTVTHPNQDYFVSADLEGKLIVWNFEGEPIWNNEALGRRFNPLGPISFSKDGKYLAITEDFNLSLSAFRIYVLDFNNRFIKTVFKEHRSIILQTTFYNNDQIVSADGDNSLVLKWNVNSNKILHSWRCTGIPFRKLSLNNELQLNLGFDKSLPIYKSSKQFQFDLNELTIKLLPEDFIIPESPKAYRNKKLSIVNENSVELTGGKVIEFDDLTEGRLQDYFFTKNGEIVAVGDLKIKKFDSSGNLLDEIAESQSGEFRSGVVSPFEKLFINCKTNQINQIRNWETGAVLLNLFIDSNGDWVFWSPKGYFHASQEGMNYLKWYEQKKNQLLPIPIENLRQQRNFFHNPDLIKKILFTGQSDISIIKAGNETLLPQIELNIATDQTRRRLFNLKGKIKSISGLKNIIISLNGNSSEKKVRKTGKITYSLAETLTLTPGKNKIIVTAANSKGKIISKTLTIDFDASPQLTLATGHINPINQLALSPDGKFCASASDDNTLKVWDINTGGLFRMFDGSQTDAITFTSGYESVDFHPKKSNIICGAYRFGLFLYDIFNGEKLLEYIDKDYQIEFQINNDLQIDIHSILKVYFIDKGEKVLIIGTDGKLKILNTTNNQIEKVYDIEGNGVSAASLSPNGKSVFLLNKKNEVIEFDFINNQTLKKVRLQVPVTNFEAYRDMSFITTDSQNEIIAIGGRNKNQIEVLNWKTSETLYTIPIDNRTFCTDIMINPKNSQLILSYINRPITIFNLNSGSKEFDLGESSQTAITLLFDPFDNNKIYSGQGISNNFFVHSWLLEQRISNQIMGNNLPSISAVSLTPKNNYLVNGGNDNHLRIWDLQKGKCKFIPYLESGCPDIIGILDVTANENLTAVTYCNNQVIVYDIKETTPIFKKTLNSPAKAIEFNPNEDIIAIGTDELMFCDLSNKQTVSIGEHQSCISDIEFSLDGQLVASVDPKELKIWKVNDKQNIQSISLESITKKRINSTTCELADAIVSEVAYANTVKLAFSIDKKYVYLVGVDYGSIVRVNIQTGKHDIIKSPTIKFDQYISISIHPYEQFLAVGNMINSKIEVYDLENLDHYRTIGGHQGAIDGLLFNETGDWLISSSKDGTIRFWNWKMAKEEIRLSSTSDFKYVINTDDYYYTSNQSSFNTIHFEVNNQLFPFEQFDVQLNRPDLVLKKLGNQESKISEAYHKAYLKRLEKLGLKETDLELNFFEIPECEIKKLSLKNGIQTIQIDGNGNGKRLKRLNIFVNDVPFFGKNGLNFDNKTLEISKREFSIPLSSGKNKIQVSVLNEAGVESLKETVYVNHKPSSKKPNLYLIAAGVSNYDDPTKNLNYPTKDALDIKELFESSSYAFDEIIAETLIDEDFNKNELTRIKNLLKNTTVDDCVIIFYAGHGVFDSNLDYFLSTTKTDFNNPSADGLTIDDLENVLDVIPARQKLLLIDACNSGEIDKKYIKKAEELNKTKGKSIVFRIPKETSLAYSEVGLENSFEMMRELFVDLRRGSGTTIIAAANGVESAREGDQWNNGVFTFALINGLISKSSDMDKNGQVNISELQRYLSSKVAELTNNLQKPVSRIENISNDWRVW